MGREEMAARVAHLKDLYEELGSMTLRSFYYQGVVRTFWASSKRAWYNVKQASKKARVEGVLPNVIDPLKKQNDPAFKRWAERRGEDHPQYELDALPPARLQAVLEDEVRLYVDWDREEFERREDESREELRDRLMG